MKPIEALSAAEAATVGRVVATLVVAFGEQASWDIDLLPPASVEPIATDATTTTVESPSAALEGYIDEILDRVGLRRVEPLQTIGSAESWSAEVGPRPARSLA
ncbi:hypothetical protein ET445_12560 [Agromyces protaetiae]|uniref:Uncharacterized protein n=1 Tax=Agromyces protaetiae TaxID=2509455 RepID=A0A4P6FDS3_9MICO|nr:hypothetical protein [Agromyces protaetiae]QAY74045.1 hypothetical protein ET445_12560 [Agromyces protaetiae]